MRWRARPGALVAANGRCYWLIDRKIVENAGLSGVMSLDELLVQDFSNHNVTSIHPDTITSVLLPAPSCPDYIPEHILETYNANS